MCFDLLTWLFECFKGLHLWTYPFIQLCNHFGSQSIVNFVEASPMFNRFLHDLEAQPQWAEALVPNATHPVIAGFYGCFFPQSGHHQSAVVLPVLQVVCLRLGCHGWTKLLRFFRVIQIGTCPKMIQMWLFWYGKCGKNMQSRFSDVCLRAGFWLAMLSGSELWLEPDNWAPKTTISYRQTLWQTNITVENHNFWWENPLFLWSFSIAMLVYQRVCYCWLWTCLSLLI